MPYCHTLKLTVSVVHALAHASVLLEPDQAQIRYHVLV